MWHGDNGSAVPELEHGPCPGMKTAERLGYESV